MSGNFFNFFFFIFLVVVMGEFDREEFMIIRKFEYIEYCFKRNV